MRRLSAFLILSVATTAPVRAQVSPNGVLESPLPPADFLTVERVDADGTVVLGPAQAIPPQALAFIGSAMSEGYYVLVSNGAKSGARQVLRVQITDIAVTTANARAERVERKAALPLQPPNVAQASVTVRTSPEAVAKLKPGDGVVLVRPLGSTTSKLRALPDVIPLPADAASAVGDPEAQVRALQQARAKAQSVNHLKQIGLAMHNFYSTFDHFPPAVIFGPDGRPWHSWRVLLLPYVEEAVLYNQYDFSQPWDSEKNRKLLDRAPEVYRDPIYGDAKDSSTHYAVIVSPDGVFRPEGAKQTDLKNPPLGAAGVRLQDVTDGTSNTIAVTQVDPARKIPWTRPEDITFGPNFPGLGKPGGIAAPYTLAADRTKPAALFLYTDGSVHTVGASINPVALKALVTRAGGEVIGPNGVPGETPAQLSRPRRLVIRGEGAAAKASIE
jgi:hypothetical protein